MTSVSCPFMRSVRELCRTQIICGTNLQIKSPPFPGDLEVNRHWKMVKAIVYSETGPASVWKYVQDWSVPDRKLGEVIRLSKLIRTHQRTADETIRYKDIMWEFVLRQYSAICVKIIHEPVTNITLRIEDTIELSVSIEVCSVQKALHEVIRLWGLSDWPPREAS